MASKPLSGKSMSNQSRNDGSSASSAKASVSSPVVLVTRPEGAASERLCNTLEAAGYTVYSQPLLQLEALPELPQAARSMVLDLAHYQHVIFISANAVQFGLDYMEDYWPQWPTGLHWYAVGHATAALLSERAITALTPGKNMSSEGLLALASLQDVRDQRVLIIKGEGGRNTLSAQLTLRGASVDELACYRRLPVALPKGELARRFALWGVQFVLISSGEGIVNLVELISPTETNTLDSLCLIVPSQRIVELARELGFKTVIIAENASDAAMLEALEARWAALEARIEIPEA